MKRLTETTKWNDPWFQELSPTSKLLWLYLLDNCDNSGVIIIDFEQASLQIGEPINELDSSIFGHRLKILSDRKYWIPEFIQDHWGTPNGNSPIHRQIRSLIRLHNLDLHQLVNSVNTNVNSC